MGDDDEEPEGAPRSTRRKKAYGMMERSRALASASDVTLGAFLSLPYAGERSALMADLPMTQMDWLDVASQLAYVVTAAAAANECVRTFEVVYTFPIENAHFNLYTRFTTPQKIDNIADILRSLCLLLHPLKSKPLITETRAFFSKSRIHRDKRCDQCVYRDEKCFRWMTGERRKGRIRVRREECGRCAG